MSMRVGFRVDALDELRGDVINRQESKSSAAARGLRRVKLERKAQDKDRTLRPDESSCRSI